MGNNRAYTCMEATVVGLYNLLDPKGQFDLPVLDVLCAPYAHSDIDHGGMIGLTTYDGLDADAVIVKVADPETFEQIMKIKNEEKRGDAIYDAFQRIGQTRWKWWD